MLIPETVSMMIGSGATSSCLAGIFEPIRNGTYETTWASVCIFLIVVSQVNSYASAEGIGENKADRLSKGFGLTLKTHAAIPPSEESVVQKRFSM
jgi:hypothetical protein